MTNREKNRLREHTADGHELFIGKTNDIPVENHYAVGEASLCKCRCGWMGWLSNSAIEEASKEQE